MNANFGGEGGIRTLAPCYKPTPLAGEPLRPLEYFSIFSLATILNTRICNEPKPRAVTTRLSCADYFILPNQTVIVNHYCQN